MNMRHVFLMLMLAVAGSLTAQVYTPVKWEFGLYESAEAGKTDLVLHATVDPCWHVYSQFLDSPDGPLPTYIEASLPAGADSTGGFRECTPIVAYDPNFMMDLKFFEEEVYWVATLDLSGAATTDSIRGFVSFMVCDSTKCLPPEDVPFALSVGDVKPGTDRPEYCPALKHLCGGHGAGGLEQGRPRRPDVRSERPDAPDHRANEQNFTSYDL